MKLLKILSVAILFWIFLGAFSSQAQDTVVVELGNDAKVIIEVKNRDAFPALKELDLNQILRDIIKQLDTAGKQAPIIEKDVQEVVYQYEWDVEGGKLTLVATVDTANTLSNTSSNTYSSNNYKRTSRRTRVFWTIDIGLNNYFEGGSIPNSNDPYSLRPWGSRYVAFTLHQRTRIGGDRSPLSIQWGTELSFYNFMFENNNYIVQGENGVTFSDYEEDFGESLDKTKLHTSYISIPLMFNLRFRNYRGRRTYNLGFGAYTGYRLGGRSKVKFGRTSDKERDNFFLRNWRYGLVAEAGYRDLNIFFKYDLSELFEDGRGPALNAFAFGIRF